MRDETDAFNLVRSKLPKNFVSLVERGETGGDLFFLETFFVFFTGDAEGDFFFVISSIFWIRSPFVSDRYLATPAIFNPPAISFNFVIPKILRFSFVCIYYSAK